MTVTYVVLAAGRGRRLGGPKALLACPSSEGGLEPLAVSHVKAGLRWGCEQIIVVTRETVAARLKPFLRFERCRIVVSHAPDEWGPAGSLAVAYGGLARRVAESTDAAEGRPAVLVSPVDCPPVDAVVVHALRKRFESTGAMAVKPRFRGLGGHPVLVAQGALSPYAESEPLILRELLRSLGTGLVECAFDEVASDIDTPADYARLFGPDHEVSFFVERDRRVRRLDTGR